MKPGRFQQALVGLVILLGITTALLGGVILVLAEETGMSVAHAPTTFYIPTLQPTIQRTHTQIPQNTTFPDTPRPDTPTRTVTADATVPPRPTHRPTRTATSTTGLTATLTPTEALTSTPCHIAAGWVSYRVQPGDTIFLIGLRYGVRVDTMLRGNCLSTSLIHVGGDIYVPPVTPRPISTFLLTPAAAADDPPDVAPTSTLTATDGACTSRDSVIQSPKVGAILSGTVKITGTARMSDFASFRLELRQEGTQQAFAPFFTGHEPVKNGTLAELDTLQWPNGEYWLRLVVVDSLNNYPERCSILVVFLNG